MCGRFVLKATAEELMERFGISDFPDGYEIGYNLAPTMTLPVIVDTEGHSREVRMMDWGFLIPDRPLLINAKSETAATLRTWKGPLRESRCIVPASGYFEWQGPKGSKQPYYIHQADDELIGFAGLWRSGRDKEGHPVDQFSIMTTAPQESIAHIHDRMPVIVHPEDEALWLDREITDPDAVASVLVPYDGALAAYKIGSRVGNTRNNDPSLIEPIAEQQGF